MSTTRAIITITKQNGSFLYSFESGKAFQAGHRAGGDAAAAAATAMDIAIRHGAMGYVIFAPKEVLDLIPDDLRSRGATA